MKKKSFPIIATLTLIASLLGVQPVSASPTDSPQQAFKAPKAKFTEAVAFDVSPVLRNLAKKTGTQATDNPESEPVDIRPDRGPEVVDYGFSGDGALSGGRLAAKLAVNSAATVSAPIF